jgi:hypothetical protein
MTAAVLKINTANTTNLTKVKDTTPATLKGVAALNTTAAAIFLKFFWYVPTAAAPTPTVGTTVPDITIELPALGTTTGNVLQSWPDGIQKAGQLFLAVTNLAADADATVVTAGAGLISVIYE